MSGPYREPEPRTPERRILLADALHFALNGTDYHNIIMLADEDLTINVIELSLYLRTHKAIR